MANEEIDADSEEGSWSKVWDLLREIAQFEVPAKIAKPMDLVDAHVEPFLPVGMARQEDPACFCKLLSLQYKHFSVVLA